MKRRIKFVFVSGPYSGMSVDENVKIAKKFTNDLIDNNFVPITPHLWHHLGKERHYIVWLRMAVDLMERADAVLRIPGESDGADQEVKEAKRMGIPVFYGIDDIIRQNKQIGESL